MRQVTTAPALQGTRVVLEPQNIGCIHSRHRVDNAIEESHGSVSDEELLKDADEIHALKLQEDPSTENEVAIEEGTLQLRKLSPKQEAAASVLTC